MSDPQNYMLHVNCPHCNAHHLVAISGFGGELATREKFCSECDDPQSATIWRSGGEANEYKAISGFKSFGSDRWEIKTLFYR